MSIKFLEPPRNAWYIACPSTKLRRKPVRVVMFGRPYVLFRPKGAPHNPAVLDDRCPHRNVPLSLGRITDAGLECSYHGWTFGADGICHNVPSLEGRGKRSRQVACRPVLELDGYIWVWLGQASPISQQLPYTSGHFWEEIGTNDKFSRFDYQSDLDGDFVSNIENILDVPHTSYLHRGWFRQPPRPDRPGRFLEVTTRALPAGFEASFAGESAPAGFLGRLLAGGSGQLEHSDRFYLPNVAQVYYSLGKYRLMILNWLVPAQAGRLKLYTTVLYKLPIPSFIVRLVAKPAAIQVLRQDQFILKQMANNIEAFGETKFLSTEADLIRPGVEALLTGRKMPPGRKVRLRIG